MKVQGLGEDFDDSVDDVEDKVEEKQEEKQEDQKKPEGDDLNESISKEELFALRQKANVLDLIDRDPDLSTYVLGKLTGQPMEKPPAPKPGETPNPNPDVTNKFSKEIQELKGTISMLRAQMEVERFSKSHPDFEPLRKDIGTLMTKHPTMKLDEAYEAVKRTRAPVKKGSGSNPEGKVGAIPRGNKVESVRDAVKAIFGGDQKPKSFEDAFDKAVAAAKELHSFED